MNRALVATAVAEILNGVALLLFPALVGRLLLGVDLAGMAIPVAQVAGMALVGLGIACGPGPPVAGMLVYGAGVAIYLAWLGFRGDASGILLWPAVAAHLILAVLMLRGMVRAKPR